MRLFDAHVHLDRIDDLDAAWSAARARGVAGWLVPGVRPSEAAGAVALAAKQAGVRFAVGAHPEALAGGGAPDALAEGVATAAAAHAPSAIGECGLDARLASQGAPMDAQRRLFDAHIALARRLSLPLVVHCVRAYGAVLDALAAGGPLPAGGVLHAYAGSAEMVPRFARLGLSFGVGHLAMREGARRVHEAIRAIPSERLLLETDAPYGRLGADRVIAPADLREVASAVAGLRDEPLDALAATTWRNAERLFGAPS